MTNSCSHGIEIINLENGESITHSVLLIRGKVTGHCTRGNEITLQIVASQNQQQFQKATLGRKGEFKILVDLGEYLQPLEIEFILRYCEAQHNLAIVYTASSKCYRVQPLYIICQGENGQANAEDACQLIDLNLLLVQSLFAEKLRENGFGRLSFRLNGKCQVFKSTLSCEEAWKSTEDELWQVFGTEILNSAFGKDRKLKFVAFIACTTYDGASVVAQKDYTYANIRRHLKAHAALGGGGLALFGSGYFYAWPSNFRDVIACFRNESKVDLAKFPDDSNYRRTYSGVYATSLGAVCHEVGHIFDLGHTTDGIMGVDFDYVNRFFTVDTLTEHLPKRHIHREAPVPAPPLLHTPHTPRFTQLRAQTGTFLEKYHEQRRSDGCGFTRNCAVILAHHLWIRELSDSEIRTENPDWEPKFDAVTRTVISGKGESLKLVELRCKTSSLVNSFYEFPARKGDKPVLSFTLPQVARELSGTHYVFVITIGGCTKKFFFDKEEVKQ